MALRNAGSAKTTNMAVVLDLRGNARGSQCRDPETHGRPRATQQLIRDGMGFFHDGCKPGLISGMRVTIDPKDFDDFASAMGRSDLVGFPRKNLITLVNPAYGLASKQSCFGISLLACQRLGTLPSCRAWRERTPSFW